jgi:hypothetical protein
MKNAHRERAMFERRMLIAIAAGVAVVWGESRIGHIGLGAWYQAGFGALVGFLAGGFGLPTRGFFGGMLGSLLCVLIFGLAGSAYDRYMIVIAGPLLAIWILGVAGLSFVAGRLVNVTHA